MKQLNQTVWYLGYIVSILPVSLITFYYLGSDFWVCTPLLIGIIGTLIVVYIGRGTEYDLSPPPVVDYPVPFIGLSTIGASQVGRLLKCALLTMALPLGFSGVPVLIVLAGLIAIPIALVMVVMAICIIPYLLVVDGIYLLAVFVAKIVDRHQYRVNTGKLVCPECGKASYRPSYNVSGTMIEGLCPTNKGIFHIEMETDNIPCFGSRSGRKKLLQCCPECEARVDTEEGKPYVVSMAGAPSSGKTSFVFSVLGNLVSSSGNGKANSFSFYNPGSNSVLSSYRAGSCSPTPLTYRPPRILTFESKQFPTKRHVYMCDVSGKFFSSEVSTDLQPQYSYNDAIVFVFDPTCAHPTDVAFAAYIGFIEKYRLFNRLDASKKIAVPIAVVATHADRFSAFGTSVGVDLREKMVNEGYFTLVNMIEKDFTAVSFFSCDATEEGGVTSDVMRHLCSSTKADIAQFF